MQRCLKIHPSLPENVLAGLLCWPFRLIKLNTWLRAVIFFPDVLQLPFCTGHSSNRAAWLGSCDTVIHVTLFAKSSLNGNCIERNFNAFSMRCQWSFNALIMILNTFSSVSQRFSKHSGMFSNAFMFHNILAMFHTALWKHENV